MSLMRAIVSGTLFGQVQTRNMFVADVIPSGGDTANVLWLAYLTNIYAQVNNIVSTAYTAVEVEYQAPLGHQWETTYQGPFVAPGNVSGQTLPNAVALVLLGKAAGIRHIGRKFFSGLAESSTDGNILVGAAVASAATALAAYILPFTGIGGGIITPGVADSLMQFHPFVGGVVSSLLGSQRRRKPGLGI